MILQVGYVVPDRGAENVGQLAARFFQDDLRRAGVPDLCSRAEVYVNVARALGKQPDLQAYRASPACLFEPEILDHAIHSLTPMMARNGELHSCEIALFRNTNLLGSILSCDECPLSRNSRIQNVVKRQINDSRDSLTRVCQSYLHGEITVLLDKNGSSVDRVDYPRTLLRKSVRGVILLFFGKNSVVGIDLGQTVNNYPACRPVGFCNRFVKIIDPELFLGDDFLCVIFENDIACF